METIKPKEETRVIQYQTRTLGKIVRIEVPISKLRKKLAELSGRGCYSLRISP